MLTVSALRVLAALFSFAALTAGSSAAMSSMDLHREAVDEQRYPWSAVGKLFNGTGAACSGVVISHDAILTAAHCLYNARVGRFIPAEELHFLVGYRTGNYSTHARIASYQIGPGFEIGMSHLHRGISARFNARLPQNLRVRQLQSLSLATGAATSAMPLHARSYLNLRGLGLAG